MLRGQYENRRRGGHFGLLERLRRRFGAPRQGFALTHELADRATSGRRSLAAQPQRFPRGFSAPQHYGPVRPVRVQAMVQPGQKVQALPKQRDRPKEAGQQPGRRNVQFSRHAQNHTEYRDGSVRTAKHPIILVVTSRKCKTQEITGTSKTNRKLPENTPIFIGKHKLHQVVTTEAKARQYRSQCSRST